MLRLPAVQRRCHCAVTTERHLLKAHRPFPGTAWIMGARWTSAYPTSCGTLIYYLVYSCRQLHFHMEPVFKQKLTTWIYSFTITPSLYPRMRLTWFKLHGCATWILQSWSRESQDCRLSRNAAGVVMPAAGSYRAWHILPAEVDNCGLASLQKFPCNA